MLDYALHANITIFMDHNVKKKKSFTGYALIHDSV